jgi:hypothetical protein
MNLQILADLTFGSEGSMYDELSEVILAFVPASLPQL